MLKKFKHNQFLFEELVKRDFKKKYKRTILGMAWSVLSPLLLLLVMRLVFTQFFGRDTPHYTTYLFCGNLVFSYFRESTNEGMSSLLGNAKIFSKINVPKYLFLFSKNIQTLINFGRPYQLLMEVHFPAVSDCLPGALQYRDRNGPLGAVRVLPGYPVSLDGLSPAFVLSVRDFLYDRPVQPVGPVCVLPQPDLCIYPLFPKDRYRGGDPGAEVPFAAAVLHGDRAWSGMLDVCEVQSQVLVLCVMEALWRF